MPGQGECGSLAVDFGLAPGRLGFQRIFATRRDLGHVGLFNLALKSGVGRAILSVFQAPGRMPLTIYLSASILTMLIIFPGFGCGQFGHYGWAGLELIALAVIAGQLVFANVWMLAFESGPIDWVWKSLAYRKAQPFRKAIGPRAVLQPAE